MAVVAVASPARVLQYETCYGDASMEYDISLATYTAMSNMSMQKTLMNTYLIKRHARKISKHSVHEFARRGINLLHFELQQGRIVRLVNN